MASPALHRALPRFTQHPSLAPHPRAKGHGLPGKTCPGATTHLMGVLLWGCKGRKTDLLGLGKIRWSWFLWDAGYAPTPLPEDGGTHQLSVERVQGEPESHSAALALSDRLHPVGVLAARREADHPPTLGLDGGLQGNSTAGLARLHTLPVPGLTMHQGLGLTGHPSAWPQDLLSCSGRHVQLWAWLAKCVGETQRCEACF